MKRPRAAASRLGSLFGLAAVCALPLAAAAAGADRVDLPRGNNNSRIRHGHLRRRRHLATTTQTSTSHTATATSTASSTATASASTSASTSTAASATSSATATFTSDVSISEEEDPDEDNRGGEPPESEDDDDEDGGQDSNNEEEEEEEEDNDSDDVDDDNSREDDDDDGREDNDNNNNSSEDNDNNNSSEDDDNNNDNSSEDDDNDNDNNNNSRDNDDESSGDGAAERRSEEEEEEDDDGNGDREEEDDDGNGDREDGDEDDDSESNDGGGGGDDGDGAGQDDSEEDDDATDGYAYRTTVRIDSESDDNTDDQPALSLIIVLTPVAGEELVLDSGYEVTWTIDDPEGSDSSLFHIDVYDCGEDPLCNGGCGAFVAPLCPEVGCYTLESTVKIRDDDEVKKAFKAGPYFKLAISPDDGSSYAGCSGSFTVAGDSDDDDDDDDSTDASRGRVEPESNGGSTDSEAIEEVVKVDSGSCDSLDDIPYPLQGNLVLKVDSDVGGILCSSPKTVYISGGTLTIATDHEETFVFTGVRFVVEEEASLIFTTEAATEFNGIFKFPANGGILSVDEGGAVDMSGRATFRGNSIQANDDTALHHGAAIYNEGSVRLRGGASFVDNSVFPFQKEKDGGGGAGAGDGGAVWNGPQGTLVVDLAADLEGNGVGAGGSGGGLWNAGYVRFMDVVHFSQNEAIVNDEDDSDDDSDDDGGGGGYGGGVFNSGGTVRFWRPVTFSDNTAQAGSAFVNSGGGKVVTQQELVINDNVSKEEKGSEAGAVWNQADSVLLCKDSASWQGNRGYNGGAMVNYGKVVFRGELMVRDNSAVLDGGGFINESGAKMVFYDGAEFIANEGTGYGGAILNHAELDFIADSGVPFKLNFEDNYCGEEECQDIQNKDGSDVSGLRDVSDLCAIGNQYISG